MKFCVVFHRLKRKAICIKQDLNLALPVLLHPAYYVTPGSLQSILVTLINYIELAQNLMITQKSEEMVSAKDVAIR